MASNQPLPVQIPMQSVGQTNHVQMVPVIRATEAGDNRFPRWSYLIFGIGMFLYHFTYFWIWAFCALMLSFLPGLYGPLFLFCGALPAAVTFILLIADSTAFCVNTGTGPIERICCCPCGNSKAMAIMISIAATLRVILWISIFGIAVDLFNYETEDLEDEDSEIDNLFWMVVCLGSFDVGPLICLAVDWWWYYGKQDYNGLFGHKHNPLRCVTGQSIVIFLISWSFIGMLEELGDADWIWPWILHGIISTLLLIVGAVLQFSGNVNGAYVQFGAMKYVMWLLGAATGIMFLIIWYYVLLAMGALIGLLSLLIFGYGLYYTSMVLPTIWALFSFKSGRNPSYDQARIEAQSMMSPQRVADVEY